SIDIPDDVPAIGLETLRCIVREPAADVAVDRNAVVIVKRDQLTEAQGTRQRTSFVADAFHKAPVAQENVGMVIDDRHTVPVELGGKQPLCYRHADGVCHTLPE